jgi:hypothetical protein
MHPPRVSSVQRAVRGAIALAVACAFMPAHADDAADIEKVRASTIALISMLVEQGVLSRERADLLLAEATLPAKTSAAAAAPAAASAPGEAAPVPAGTVRVPYIPAFVRKEIKDELRAELIAQAGKDGWAGPGAVPEWVRRVQWYGDLRVREQYDNFITGNAPAYNVTATNQARSIVLLNTTEDRTRSLVRARVGLAAAIDENWTTDVRLTTGSTTSPVSSNQTLGTYDNRYTVALDRANIRYRRGGSLNAVAGRFGNPWFGTDLVWANDLSFDGLAVQWLPELGKSTRAFVTLAASPVQEVELSNADKWLLGAQVGLDANHILGEASAKLGLAFYDYRNIVGQASPTGSAINEFTAVQFAQKGNTYYNISSDANKPLLGLASDFHLVNLTGALDVPLVAGKHVLLTGDFVKNVGYKRAATSARVGVDVAPKTTGWLLRGGFGDAEVSRAGTWQLFSAYKHVERDAVLDAFTDSDLRLGGTDAKGYTLGGSYGLGRDTAATLRLMSADSISGAPLSIDVLQLDLAVRF